MKLINRKNVTAQFLNKLPIGTTLKCPINERQYVKSRKSRFTIFSYQFESVWPLGIFNCESQGYFCLGNAEVLSDLKSNYIEVHYA